MSVEYCISSTFATVMTASSNASTVPQMPAKSLFPIFLRGFFSLFAMLCVLPFQNRCAGSAPLSDNGIVSYEWLQSDQKA